MQEVEVSATDSPDVDVDLLAVPVLEPAPPLTGAAGELDARLDGLLSRIAEAGEFRGAFNRAVVVHAAGGLRARRVALAGLGPGDRLDADAFRTAGGAVAREAREFGASIGWVVDRSFPVPPAEQAQALVEGTLLGAYDPGLYKTGGGRPGIGRVVVVGENVQEATERAARVSAWTNRARDLSNMPPNELTPQRLAARAEEIAFEQEHVHAQALGLDEIRDLGMGAFAAVAQGSDNPPRLIVMRYDPPGARDDLVLGLVGKAITFDTGGISIKPGLYMEDMKGDMSGGGAVVEATGAVADLGVPLRVLSVVAAAENMPGGGAYRPGDILQALNGKTIEVINTDAEGRLVLADALTYARRQGATHLLDLATLTGAMELALGDLYAGVYANDDEWREAVVEAGEASGDHLWPFPLHPRYRRYIDSAFADMKNASVLRQGSPTLAASFLQEFAGEGPWAHIDLAGPAFFRYDRGDYLSQRGGTGYGVRLTVELATSLAR
jgi:leucyl aminopeptidase